jgi:hypothetical protein
MLGEVADRALAALGLVWALAACSEDEATKKPPPGAGGVDASEAAAGRGGSGGTTAGTNGASGTGAGTGGSAGSIDAAPDVVADVNDAGPADVVADTTEGGLECSPREAGAEGGGTWRDFAAGVCKACPTSPLSCTDLLGPPTSVFDTRTGIATIHLAPGRAEIVSGTWTLNYQGETEGGSIVGTTTVAFQVNGNTLTANVKQAITDPVDSVSRVHESDILLDDACGVRHQASNSGSSLDFSLTSDGGETLFTARCLVD